MYNHRKISLIKNKAEISDAFALFSVLWLKCLKVRLNEKFFHPAEIKKVTRSSRLSGDWN